MKSAGAQAIYSLLQILFGVIFLVNFLAALFMKENGNRANIAVYFMLGSGTLCAIVSALAHSACDDHKGEQP